ncbi:hypothetical protein GFL21_15235 [Rhizobium anhuiense]|uniref:hypothetical protein n=1 Tax=Rhizobium anhuiense TaxID=1184720 RepID=UPI001441862E|nr:hypothetical protein [Rhizobium anhuiense]NKM55864.1 hypothetical protein [Rhizobium anhuiense]
MSLDDLYGPMAEPGRETADVEKKYNPLSLDELSDSTAPLLKQYMDSAVQGLKMPQVIHDSHVILWLISEDEKILFALEEVIDGETGDFFATRSRNDRLKIPADKTRIGHPSLLPIGQDKRARIGGEIVYDPEGDCWVINNSSGRYGYRSHQTKLNLDAAAGLFAKHGINLDVEYIAPRVNKEEQ